MHLPDAGRVWPRDRRQDSAAGPTDPKLGLLGMLALLLHAYSLGAGTYTGIEAVSNSMQVMREPRVATGQADDALHGHLAGLHGRRLIVAYLLLGHPADRRARR